MHIREAIENDLPQMLVIYNDIILHTTAVYDYEPHTLEMRISIYNPPRPPKMRALMEPIWASQAGLIRSLQGTFYIRLQPFR